MPSLEVSNESSRKRKQEEVINGGEAGEARWVKGEGTALNVKYIWIMTFIRFGHSCPRSLLGILQLSDKELHH